METFIQEIAEAAGVFSCDVRIEENADLSDMFGGQTDFQVAVWVDGDIVGVGHTVGEAVEEAVRSCREWSGR